MERILATTKKLAATEGSVRIHAVRYSHISVCKLILSLKNGSLSLVSTYLSELLDLGSLHSNDGASEALVDQQTQLTVKVHAIVLLILSRTLSV